MPEQMLGYVCMFGMCCGSKRSCLETGEQKVGTGLGMWGTAQDRAPESWRRP